VLVFDLMEPLRPVVDRVVLGLVQQHVFTPGDFTITAKRVCRLNPPVTMLTAKLDDSAVFDTTDHTKQL
jgi:CRISPR-associated protein Cas1